MKIFLEFEKIFRLAQKSKNNINEKLWKLSSGLAFEKIEHWRLKYSLLEQSIETWIIRKVLWRLKTFELTEEMCSVASFTTYIFVFRNLQIVSWCQGKIGLHVMMDLKVLKLLFFFISFYFNVKNYHKYLFFKHSS